MARMTEKKLLLADIKDLGGTKDDLDLLEGVDEENLSEIEFEELPADSRGVEFQEINTFLRSIGLKTSQGIRGQNREKQKLGADTGKDKKHGRKSNVCLEAEARLRKLEVKLHKKLLVPLDSDEAWFQQSDSEMCGVAIHQAVLDHLTGIGERLMETEVQLFQKARQKSKGTRDVLWLKTVLSSGTLGDKVAALTLLVQESPVHTLSSLDTLLTMAAKKGKREGILAADALKELWISDLLPEDRKLKSLKQRPLHTLAEETSGHVVNRKLVLWFFEDQLKEKFARFLNIIKLLSHDTVAKIREKMLGCVFDLLYRKPEQEQELLSQLTNKLGDPVKRVSSKAILFLLKLVSHHINMKAIVAKELERLLHRPNMSLRAQYYTICTLNQFVITPEDQELAQKLVEIYFTFFKVYTSKKELDAKMLAALLTGVNRAFPYVQGEIPSFEEHLQSLFKVVYVGPLATGIQSLVLLYQVMESRQAVSGRYYQALYTKLLDPQLRHSKKQAIFLNLLFKSLKSDPEMKRVKAFLKRILQVCAFHSPPFVCGCLFLISEVLKQRTDLWPFILQSEAGGMEHFADVGEERVEGHDHHEARRNQPHNTSGYQIAGRNPLYCKAERSCSWELTRLGSHYHPSVQAFAKKVAQGGHIEYRGDPLQDFTLMRFLDRFVCKNPKQKVNDHGGSLMQRTSKLLKTHQKEIAINSAEFAALGEAKVREDELFMHKYFADKRLSERGVKAGDADEVESVQSETVQEDMDFASELERQKKVVSHKKRKKKKKAETDSELESAEDSDLEMEGSDLEGLADGDLESEGDSSEQDLSADDFDYGSGFSDEEESAEEGGTSSQAHMEKLLLDNLSSDDDNDGDASSEEGMVPAPLKKRKGQKEELQEEAFDVSSMFADAEEYAHLLEHGAREEVERTSERQQSRGHAHTVKSERKQSRIHVKSERKQSRMHMKSGRKHSSSQHHRHKIRKHSKP